MGLRCLAIAFGVAMAATTTIARASDRPRISVDEARALVMSALTEQQRRMPGAAAEYDGGETKRAARFIGITAIWNGVPGGSVVQGVYDVDLYTGDVFSATVECRTYHNPRLQHLQVQIRHRLHLSVSEYRRIRTRGDLCAN